MHVSVRRYTIHDDGQTEEIVRVVQDGFVPIMIPLANCLMNGSRFWKHILQALNRMVQADIISEAKDDVRVCAMGRSARWLTIR